MHVLPLLLSLMTPPADATPPLDTSPGLALLVPADLTDGVPPNVVPVAWTHGLRDDLLVGTPEDPLEVSEDVSLSDFLRIWNEEGHEVPADMRMVGRVITLHPHEPLAEGTYLLSADAPTSGITFAAGEEPATDTEELWFLETSRFVVRGPQDHTPPAVPAVHSVVWSVSPDDEARSDASASTWSAHVQLDPSVEPGTFFVRLLDADGRLTSGPHRAPFGAFTFTLPGMSPDDTTFEIQAVDLAGNLSEPVFVGPGDGLYQVESPGCSHVSAAPSAIALWWALPGMLGLWGRRRRETGT